MKLGFYDDFKLGLIQEGQVVDLSKAAEFIRHTSPQDLMGRLIEGFADHRPHLEEASTHGTATPVGQVRLRPPLPVPPPSRRNSQRLAVDSSQGHRHAHLHSTGGRSMRIGFYELTAMPADESRHL